MKQCDVRDATHVKVDGKIERIIRKWGVRPDGSLESRFGVVIEGGRSVSMYDANLYFKQSLPHELLPIVEVREVAHLTEDQVAIINRGHCPDCGHRGFVMGPRGGLSTNIECANIECLARFNVYGNPLSHHIIAGHRIEKRSDGGATNWGYPP